MMEVDKGSSRSNEERPLECKSTEAKKIVDNGGNSPVFINHAVIAWHESRRKWIGDTSQKLPKASKDQIISWSMTYEDLLSTHDPFSERIPLTYGYVGETRFPSASKAHNPQIFQEMVDFLVDIWHDEGLFD